MTNLESKLTKNMDFFKDREVDFSKYETSFRRWLVQEIESKRMSWQEARERFQFQHRFDKIYKEWQKKHSEEIVISLPLMNAQERLDFQKLEERIKRLERELELAQMRGVAMNTMIDIAEKDYKLQIRKKSGPKQ
jgi:hypothetical protein